MDKQGVFVFVVCGAREHIDTLHFSLRYLRHFSKHPIWIVTDSSRNEIAIAHHNVVDVPTPAHFNHHQASVYLKTGLPQFLPKGQLYCYLDTDVVAVNHKVDDIFNQYRAPITFAPDHCTMREFSPYSVNCGCKVDDSIKNELQRLIDQIEAAYAKGNANFKQEQDLLKTKLHAFNTHRLRKFWGMLRYRFSCDRFWLDDYFWYDKQKQLWHNAKGQALVSSMESIAKEIEAVASFKYDSQRSNWFTQEGKAIWTPTCGHLAEMIEQEFDIKISQPDWQHWNGGVFLFDDRSEEFMRQWHEKTMHIFTLPAWRTRDQGTLIATAWEMGLQNHPTLSRQWNYIADYYKPEVKLNEPTGEFSDDDFKTSLKPSLVHVYHHFGDKSWQVWQWIERIGTTIPVIPTKEG